jgi:hypothetical protein
MKTVGARVRASGRSGGGRRSAAVLWRVARLLGEFSVVDIWRRKSAEGSSGESRNWPGRMSGEP